MELTINWLLRRLKLETKLNTALGMRVSLNWFMAVKWQIVLHIQQISSHYNYALIIRYQLPLLNLVAMIPFRNRNLSFHEQSPT